VSGTKIRNDCSWRTVLIASVPRPISAHDSNLVNAHQTRHPMFAAGLSGLAEIKEYTRRIIDTITGDKGCADQAEEPHVLLSSMRYRLMQPRVIATASNLQDPAHHLDTVLIPICLDKLVHAADLPGAQFRRHWSSSVLVMPLASRVHRILGSPSQPRAGTGPHEISTLKRPFAACCKLVSEVNGAQPDCRSGANAIA